MSGSTEAMTLAKDSAAEMARLLPLYDVPQLSNTRYGLSGFQYVRLVFGDSAAAEHVELSAVEVTVPGEGTEEVPARSVSRWQNAVLEDDVDGDGVLTPVGRSVRMNVVLSRASFPRPNVLSLSVKSDTVQKLTVQVHEGRYDPLTSSPVAATWKTVAEERLEPGEQRLDVPLDWAALELTAYPTNFAKKIDGKQTNVYHVAHVRRLREIAAKTGIQALGDYADRWERYICDWADRQAYEGLYVKTRVQAVPVSAVPGCDGSGTSVVGGDQTEPEGE